MSIQAPPGASYRASNAIVKARRHLRNLEGPIRIQFIHEWKPGNELYDWYQRRTAYLIDKVELRRELEGPFYHEFIVFRLGKEGGYFRADRRQRPNEDTPLDCLKDEGVEAFDTIEEVTSMNDSLYSMSECLASLDLRMCVHLSVILKACWAIHEHPSAWVYTLQRYNCYFFARAIFMATARSLPADQSFDQIRTALSFTYDWNDLLLRFRQRDGDLHVWGIMHEIYCKRPECYDRNSWISRGTSTTINPRLPVWATNLLLEFQKSLNKFWQDTFIYLIKVASPGHGSPGKSISLFDKNGNLSQDRLMGALSILFDPAKPATISRKKLWYNHCQKYMKPLVDEFKPKMEQALACPTLCLVSTGRDGESKPRRPGESVLLTYCPKTDSG
ncbi:unnamed protein product [Rhizoctonia solani]|uniref:Uncharacterized protein n=1 Tax=Rhizoctonia solani TaxID=456999 RepID=A0A8H3AFE0_9AGAM|nr:unnamed protein product [Rhizoctonia solani]